MVYQINLSWFSFSSWLDVAVPGCPPRSEESNCNGYIVLID